MSISRTFCLLLIAALALGLQSTARAAETPVFPKPQRFEKSMLAFDEQDRQSPPPSGAIVCTGSSSMLRWHGDIVEDLAPLTVLPRAFGGSTINDLLHFADRAVIRYNPRAVVVYEGDNDVWNKIPAEQILDTFRAFVRRVHNELPEVRFYIMSIKPSIRRWELWPAMEETNALLEAWCAEHDFLTYVDVAGPMLAYEGILTRLFVADKLHMSRAGYDIWRDTLRPVLLAAELEAESQVVYPEPPQPAEPAAAPIVAPPVAAPAS